MTSAERIVYGTADAEAPLNLHSSEFNFSTDKKEPRCGLKAKLIAGGLTVVALTLGGLGYYYGSKAKYEKMPSYTYKRFLKQNQTITSAFTDSPL